MKLKNFTSFLNEGTWSLPFELKKAKELEKIMNSPLNPEKASKLLMNIFGDDILFDGFGSDYNAGITDSRETVKLRLKEILDQLDKSPKDFKTVPDDKVLDIIKKLV